MHSGKKRRFIESLATHLFLGMVVLGLAASVFAWGLEYKLSLYDASLAASHRIPEAKLLSGDEDTRTVESSLSLPRDASIKVVTAVFPALLLAFSLPAPLSFRYVKRQVRGMVRLHRALWNRLFDRPPPALAPAI
jgi:hypothetical protein